MFLTPILLIIFNRPDTTQVVLNRIRVIKPRQLFVAADGPRSDRPDDLEKCRKVRELIEKGIDWDCEVISLFRDENLGCAKGVAGAITWFFNQVDQGIILEDDCLPVPDFFQYCSILLQKFKNDDHIMHISGHNPLSDFNTAESLLFSKYSFIWGWATWARAWKKYNLAMPGWEKPATKKKIKSLSQNNLEWKYWKIHFDKYYKAGVNAASTWDYQWQYALFVHDGIAVVPAKSLVNNIGVGHQDATHTKHGDQKLAEIKENSIDLNKILNLDITNQTFDSAVFNQVFVHWLPRFNTKVFIYEKINKYLPTPVKRLIFSYKKFIIR